MASWTGGRAEQAHRPWQQQDANSGKPQTRSTSRTVKPKGPSGPMLSNPLPPYRREDRPSESAKGLSQDHPA